MAESENGAESSAVRNFEYLYGSREQAERSVYADGSYGWRKDCGLFGLCSTPCGGTWDAASDLCHSLYLYYRAKRPSIPGYFRGGQCAGAPRQHILRPFGRCAAGGGAPGVGHRELGYAGGSDNSGAVV